MTSAQDILKEYNENGVIQIVGADQMNSKGHMLLRLFVTEKQCFTPAAKLVFGAIEYHAYGENDRAWPGLKRIAKLCGISERTAGRAILQLSGKNKENLMVLEKKRRPNQANLYILYFKQGVKSDD